VLGFYKGDYVTALLSLFPDIGLKPNLFPGLFFCFVCVVCFVLCLLCLFCLLWCYSVCFVWCVDSSYTDVHWRSDENRRNFFIQFAKAKKFDPLNPSAWNKYRSKDITSFPVSFSTSSSFAYLIVSRL
jgi:hypothetical protein